MFLSQLNIIFTISNLKSLFFLFVLVTVKHHLFLFEPKISQSSWKTRSGLPIKTRKKSKSKYRRFQNIAIPNIGQYRRYYRIRYFGAIFWSDIFLGAIHEISTRYRRYIADINNIVYRKITMYHLAWEVTPSFYIHKLHNL